MTKLSVSQRNMLEKSTAKYAANLSEVLPYLESRGLTEETIERFRLGYVKEPYKGDDDYEGRLCIPYLRRVGVTAQRFRAMEDSDCKYLGRAGVSSGLFHVEAFFGESEVCVITEGEFDTIILDQIGIPSVGIAGTSGWKSHYRRLFEDFDQLIIFRDDDEAGAKLVKAIRKDFPYAISVRMPSGDVNSTYLDPEYGEAYLREQARVS